MDAFLDTAITQISLLVGQWGLKAVAAIAILLIGRIVSGWARKIARKAMSRAEVDETLIPFAAGVIYFAFLAIVVIMSLGALGINTTSLVAVFGAAGLAIALAFQGTFSNFASGVMLLVFRPISVGQFVDVGGTAGSVVEIGVFSTTLNTPDNVQITIPNSAIFGQTIHNYSANPTRRIDLVSGVGYDDDLGRALQVIDGVVGKDSRILADPAAQIAVAELADSSVNFVVRPWCKAEDYWDLRFDLTRGLKEALDDAGLSIPYPQRDVHLHNVA